MVLPRLPKLPSSVTFMPFSKRNNTASKTDSCGINFIYQRIKIDRMDESRNHVWQNGWLPFQVIIIHLLLSLNITLYPNHFQSVSDSVWPWDISDTEFDCLDLYVSINRLIIF
jgi:hypothetical protein